MEKNECLKNIKYAKKIKINDEADFELFAPKLNLIFYFDFSIGH